MNSTFHSSESLPRLRLYHKWCGWCWKGRVAVWSYFSYQKHSLCVNFGQLRIRSSCLPQWVTLNCFVYFTCLASALKFHLTQWSHHLTQPTVRYSPVHSTFTKLKPAQSLVTGAEANMDGVLGNTQLGALHLSLDFQTESSKWSYLPLPPAIPSDERHRPRWYVATPIDLSENFLFQRFIHQRVWMRRMFNGEFIIMRNLWVAVIKFALAFIERSITHPSESRGCQTLPCLLLCLGVSDAHPDVLFDSLQHMFAECLHGARYCIIHK